MSNIFWIGARESDVSCEKMFYGSITRYGTNTNNNMAFCCNNYTDSYDEFLANSLSRVLETFPNCKFIFGNSLYAYNFGNSVFDKTLCLNKLSVLETLNNKIFFRQLVSDIVNTPQSIVLNFNHDIEYKFINSIFNDAYVDYVVQSANSGGGEETYLITPQTSIKDLGIFSKQMLVTPYFHNSISINVHIALSNKDFRIFPPSIQLVSNLFHYTGSDFIKYKTLNNDIKERIISQCSRVAKKIQSLGARGLFGVDILLHDNEIYFIECNFRYQGSSFLLNKALLDYNMPSVFMIHYLSFCNGLDLIPIDVFDLSVNYSSFRRTINNRTIDLPVPTEIKSDGNVENALRNGYMYYEVFNKSIFDFLK